MNVKALSLLFGSIFLSGCVTQEFYLKSNVTYDLYERDFVSCVNQATASAPASNQVAWNPYIGVYTVDANAGLRQRNVDICMRDKGYQRLPVPPCQGEAAVAARETGFGSPARLNQRLRVAKNSCWATAPTGETLIYSPPQ